MVDAEVTVCSAAVPAQRRTTESAAAVTVAAPGAASRFVAVPASTSAAVPAWNENAPAAPVAAPVSWRR